MYMVVVELLCTMMGFLGLLCVSCDDDDDDDANGHNVLVCCWTGLKSLSLVVLLYTTHNRSVVETAATKKKKPTLFFYSRNSLALSLSVAQSILFFRRRARATSYDTALRVCVVCVLHKSLRFFGETAAHSCVCVYRTFWRGWAVILFVKIYFKLWVLWVNSDCALKTWLGMAPYGKCKYCAVYSMTGGCVFLLLGNLCAETTLLPKSRKTWCNNSD